MPAIAFDTLKYANKLKEAGVPDKQAEAQAGVMAEALEVNLENVATKEQVEGFNDRLERLGVEMRKGFSDLERLIEQMGKRLETRIDHKTQEVRQELKQVETQLEARITQVETKLEARITQVETKLDSRITQVAANLDAKID